MQRYSESPSIKTWSWKFVSEISEFIFAPFSNCLKKIVNDVKQYGLLNSCVLVHA